MKSLYFLIALGVITHGCYSMEEESSTKPPQAALQRVLADKQIDLDSREMLEMINGKKELSTNTRLVFYATIQKDHTAEEASLISQFFRDNNLFNLRSICFMGDDNDVASLITRGIFEEERKNKYASLTNIDFSETKVKDDDIEVVLQHFVDYDYFIRDMTQYSSRHGIVAAPLIIDVENTKVSNIKRWSSGVKSKKKYDTYYRSSFDQTTQAPFMISTR